MRVSAIKQHPSVCIGGFLGKATIRALTGLLLLCVVFPIAWMIACSLKTPAELINQPVFHLPSGFYFRNYSNAWVKGKMNVFYKNSVITTFVSLIFTVGFSAMIGFALTKLRWRFSGLFKLLFSFGIVVPVQMVLIPLFIMYNQLKLVNSLWGLIITYTGFSLSLAIYLYSGYMQAIPNEIMEAAVIDGCSVYSLFTRILLPLSKNATVTVLVVSFFSKWNDLIFSQTFISSTSLKTIQTGLLYFTNEFGSTEWGPVFAASTMAILPTIVVYSCLNKLVIEGMTAGAIKN